MASIPWGTLEWPRWGRIPTFFENGPSLEDERGGVIIRNGGAIERRTQLDGVAYLIRGDHNYAEVYRYADCRPGFRRAIRVFKIDQSIYEVMEELPSYLIRSALD